MRSNSRLFLLALAFVAFISLGLPDGLLGVAWPSIRSSFGLRLDALGALLISVMIGYLTSSFLSGRLLASMSVGTLLALSCLAAGVALLGNGLAPAWWLLVSLGLLSGLGGGAIDAGLNTYVAAQYSARTLNWLHACFGIGATLGPVIMTSVLDLGLSWRIGYLAVGVALVALAACFALTRALWQAEPASGAAVEAHSGASTLATLRLPAALLSMLVFFVYTGVEVTAGQWAFTLLTQGRGVNPTTAGIWVSLYWASLTVGRVLFGAVANRVPADLMLRGCLLCAAFGTGLLWLGQSGVLSLAGLLLIGLMLAPVFPSLIATTPARLGPVHTANAVGFQVATAVIGGALLPASVGVIAQRLGVNAIGPTLFVAAAALLLVYELLRRAPVTRG